MTLDRLVADLLPAPPAQGGGTPLPCEQWIDSAAGHGMFYRQIAEAYGREVKRIASEHLHKTKPFDLGQEDLPLLPLPAFHLIDPFADTDPDNQVLNAHAERMRRIVGGTRRRRSSHEHVLVPIPNRF